MNLARSLRVAPQEPGPPADPVSVNTNTVGDLATFAATASDGAARALTARSGPVPCAARPSTGFIHLDGPCRCFFGGPGPEFAPVRELEAMLTAC